jgi:hypothetical protein
MRRIIRVAVVTLGISLATASANAQVLGTFNWQMQPFCNVVTLTLTAVPTGFTLDGYDDQCGATTRGAAVGIGVFNTDGTVGVNFTIVTSPAGKGVQVSARVSPANGQGTWADSVGNSGTFAFFAAVPGLPVRPLPASGVAPASITAAEIAAAAIGAAQINTTQVQSRVSGACAVGQAVTSVNANGTVVCAATFPQSTRGTYAVNFNAEIVGDRESESISFGITLPAAPLVHWLADGAAPTAACPGTPANPQAAPGNFCVYTTVILNVNFAASCITNGGTGYGCDAADRYGATLFVSATAAGQAAIAGSWAVTLP